MKYLIPSIMLLAITASCSKSSNNPPTKTELITTGSWKYEDGGVDIDRNGTIDLAFGAGLLDPCVADNFAVFSTNGTGVADEGPTKCDPAAAQTTNFNWSFSNNETVLNITGLPLFNLGNTFNITTLTETRLGLSKDTTLPGFSGQVALLVHLKH